MKRAIIYKGLSLSICLTMSTWLFSGFAANISTRLEPASLLYGWIDDYRLLLISTNYSGIGDARQFQIQKLPSNELAVCVTVLDYNVVRAVRGRMPIGSFPDKPRRWRGNEPFWLGDLLLDFGHGNIFEKNIFLKNLLEPNDPAPAREPWLLTIYFDGWKNANIYTLLPVIPANRFSTPRLEYQNQPIPLTVYTEELDHYWRSDEIELARKFSTEERPFLKMQDVYHTDSQTELFLFAPRDMRYAEAAIRQYPDRMEGYYYRAMLQWVANPESAFADLNMAVKLAPESSIALLSRASLSYRYGDLFSAWLDASKAEHISPGYATELVEFYKNKLDNPSP